MSDLGNQLASAFKSGHSHGVATSESNRLDNGGSFTKAEVNYRKCDVNSDECCGNCKHFDGTSKCDIVAGKISESMVCDKFAPAESTTPTSESDSSTASGASSDYSE